MRLTLARAPTQEIDRLQQVTALGRSWQHETPAAMASSIAEAIGGDPAIDVVYVRINVTPTAIEVARTPHRHLSLRDTRLIGEAIDTVQTPAYEQVLRLPGPVVGRKRSYAVVPIGNAAEHGFVAAGSRLPAFPQEGDWLLLHLAANQAAVALTVRPDQWTDPECPQLPEQTLRDVQQANLSLLEAGLRAQEHAEVATHERVQLDELLGGLTEGVVVIEASGRIRFMNAAAKLILGLGTIGDDIIEIPEIEWRSTQGTVLPVEARPLRRAARGDVLDDEEFVLRDGDQLRHLQFTSNSINDASGEVALTIVTYRDVTPLRRLEMMREEDTALVSHDLRNPLAVALGAATRLARSRDAQEGDAAELLALIISNIRRMNSMIGNIIDSAYLETGGTALALEPVSLIPMVRQAVTSTLGQDIAQRVNVDATANTIIVMGDESRLVRVVENLVSNAFKYAPEESPIALHLRIDGDEAIVSVGDEGPGIPAEHVAGIFDRYYRVQANEQRREHFGLGLYTAKLIIEAHGGRIWVESEPGAGSTFSFALPLGDGT